MEHIHAEFLKSSSVLKECPEPDKPEFAFIGRSNVGKSSLINMLVNNKYLAKTSGKPGKTRLINHFIVNDQWYLVDLPGFGYAKVSKVQREKWEKSSMNYLTKRENLRMIFLLIDSRIPPQTIDLEFMEMLATKNLPFVILFTKCDKLKKKKIAQNIEEYQKELSKTWTELPFAITTSAVDKSGRDEIFSVIEQLQ